MDIPELQRVFMAHLLTAPTVAQPIAADPDLQALLTDVNPHGLGIYRNAYTARLVGVLQSDHAKLLGLVGQTAFAEFARRFIEQHPSQVRSLRYFGNRLPEFLGQQTQPHAGLLAELCAFERLLLDVYDAPDAERIGFAHIAGLATEQWPGLGLEFHPSLRLFDSPHGAVGCWQQLHAGNSVDVDAPGTSHPGVWRLWRNAERVSQFQPCLLYTSPSPRDATLSRMPSSA